MSKRALQRQRERQERHENDWNPHAQRRRKTNRPSRGKPERPRRYFVGPVCWLFAIAAMMGSGELPVAFQRMKQIHTPEKPR